jgi:hypothetical protein
MHNSASQLLAELVARQGTLSDRAYAQSLGVSHNTWTETRHGRLAPGWAVLTGAAALYPDLREPIAAYMAAVGLGRGVEPLPVPATEGTAA